MVIESGIEIDVRLPKKDVSRAMETFYNPQMKSNRDISIALLLALGKKDMNVLLPLSGSGIRGLRFLSELPKGIVGNLSVNDVRDGFTSDFKKSMKKNKLSSSNVSVHSIDANQFLLSQIGFDYIDVDPFGSPNPFLASAVARINRGGILAVTATDTGALAGTYVKAGIRKYWARSLNCYMKHELGLRILIRKVQLQGVQFGKALIPILSYHKNHYYRVFFVSSNGKKKCDDVLKQHKYFLYSRKDGEFKISSKNVWEGKKSQEYDVAGPLWVGDLHDSAVLNKMLKQNLFSTEQKFLEVLYEEAKNPNVVGFVDSHILSQKQGIDAPTMQKLLAIPETWRTQFSLHAVKTTLSISEILKMLKCK